MGNSHEGYFLRREPIGPLYKPGQLLEITTDGQVKRPLPSMALLEMQWFLHRIMGMAGAADLTNSMRHEKFCDNVKQ
jgi:hypothetical protein